MIVISILFPLLSSKPQVLFLSTISPLPHLKRFKASVFLKVLVSTGDYGTLYKFLPGFQGCVSRCQKRSPHEKCSSCLCNSLFTSLVRLPRFLKQLTCTSFLPTRNTLAFCFAVLEHFMTFVYSLFIIICIYLLGLHTVLPCCFQNARSSAKWMVL